MEFSKPIHDIASYHEYYEYAKNRPFEFWEQQAKQWLHWFSPWTEVMTGTFGSTEIHWFKGAQINAAYNCLDRHLPTKGQKIAIIWQGDEPHEHQSISYQALYEQVCSFANVLKSRGIKKGDRVCIYLPMIPEIAIAMLACARIGAIHSVVFAGFSAEALKNRIQDATCCLIITANEGKRGGKIVPLKHNVDVALKDCPSVHSVIIVQRTSSWVPLVKHRDYWFHELIREAPQTATYEFMDATDPLFILYTSGSTGQPKGVVHATGGYLLYVAMTFKLIFDYQEGEVFWCSADAGWITGHSYALYGPLLNGATTLIFEGTPHYPTPSRFWEIIDYFKVNIFYTAPTAIRALRKEGDHWVKPTKRQSLRLLGTVGEPINPEAWHWYYEVVGERRCYIVDTWWQTETGGIMISPFPHLTPLKPGSAGWPFLGIVAEILNEEGQTAQEGEMGKLVIKQPWPGILQSIYKAPDRLFENYFTAFPGTYLTSDQAKQDTDGYFWIAGRSDDVIKIAGHRIGTEEVESAFLRHPAVAEAAVVPVADVIKGEGIYAFVCLRYGFEGSDALKEDLIQTVRRAIGAIATPQFIQWTSALPKTRSGKIMRRLLRQIANDDLMHLGDVSTLAEPEVVHQIVQERLNVNKFEDAKR